jgi:hypothetical protein
VPADSFPLNIAKGIGANMYLKTTVETFDPAREMKLNRPESSNDSMSLRGSLMNFLV